MLLNRQGLKDAKRIVIKVGSSTITHGLSGRNFAQIDRLAKEISDLQNQGKEIILVSSGAVAVGIKKLNLKEKPKTVPEKQAAAAVGQGVLMHTYEKTFAEYGQIVAQILLTPVEALNRTRYTNARNTFFALISQGVIPIVNENDVVAVDELKFGDNDSLSAIVAGIVDADLVIILSDVDGLYTANPANDPNAKLVSVVEEITSEIVASAGDAGSSVGTGGMYTKIQAAKIATTSGINLVIASGSEKYVMQQIVDGKDVGTLFLSKENRLKLRKRWIAFGSKIAGKIKIDSGCQKALKREGACSILPAGIISVEGDFEVGSTISVIDENGKELARGLTHYPSCDIAKIKGLKTNELETILFHKTFNEIIHRDDLVVMQ